VVLPGVGAFADAMDSLSKSGMIEVIQKVIDSGKPFLGICLGMQLLFEYSEEGGQNKKGLGILKGAIKQLPFGMNLKVPHMGWNSLELKNKSLLFDGLPQKPYVYFVHSYYLDTDDEDIVIAKPTMVSTSLLRCKSKMFLLPSSILRKAVKLDLKY